ncbi:TPA_asm: hypothetical protein, partial [Porphyromonas phage phage024a_F0570]
LNNVWAFFMPL